MTSFTEADVARVLAEQSQKSRPFVGRPPSDPMKKAIWNEARMRYRLSKSSNSFTSATTAAA